MWITQVVDESSADSSSGNLSRRFNKFIQYFHMKNELDLNSS